MLPLPPVTEVCVYTVGSTCAARIPVNINSNEIIACFHTDWKCTSKLWVGLTTIYVYGIHITAYGSRSWSWTFMYLLHAIQTMCQPRQTMYHYIEGERGLLSPILLLTVLRLYRRGEGLYIATFANKLLYRLISIIWTHRPTPYLNVRISKPFG